jgi:HK97 family phage prohead protease
VTVAMLGLALPYEQECVIGEVRPNGERRIFREIFDQKSFDGVPKQVPLLRSHQRQAGPLGWARLDSRPGGLHTLLEPIAGSQTATDAVAEVRAGVIRGLSVGFIESPDDDLIDARNSRRLPLVRRRGVVLKEVSLCLEPAYDGAVITSVDADATAHAESEEALAPLRAEVAALAAERARADVDLLSWLDNLDEPTQWSMPEPPSTDGPVVRVAGRVFRVAPDRDGSWAVDEYLRELSSTLNRRGRALDSSELLEMQQRCGLLAIR